MFWFKLGYPLNLKNPQTFSEKLQWLKLNDKNPLYTTLVDKYAVKKYVANIIGDSYIIPTLGVWDSFEEIDFNVLPNQFVLKTSHDSGGFVACTDKNMFDFDAAKRLLSAHLKNDFYSETREWPYKNVKPRIIAEPYLEDETGELRDYKFHVFEGEPKVMYVVLNRFKGESQFIYRNVADFSPAEFSMKGPLKDYGSYDIQKPKPYELMLDLVRKLSHPFRYIRVDLYCVKDKVYFGELTLFSGSGFDQIDPPQYDKILGDMMTLPNPPFNNNEKLCVK